MLDPLASTDENDFGSINLLFATSSNSPDCRRKSAPSIGVVRVNKLAREWPAKPNADGRIRNPPSFYLCPVSRMQWVTFLRP